MSIITKNNDIVRMADGYYYGCYTKCDSVTEEDRPYRNSCKVVCGTNTVCNQEDNVCLQETLDYTSPMYKVQGKNLDVFVDKMINPKEFHVFKDGNLYLKKDYVDDKLDKETLGFLWQFSFLDKTTNPTLDNMITEIHNFDYDCIDMEPCIGTKADETGICCGSTFKNNTMYNNVNTNTNTIDTNNTNNMDMQVNTTTTNNTTSSNNYNESSNFNPQTINVDDESTSNIKNDGSNNNVLLDIVFKTLSSLVDKTTTYLDKNGTNEIFGKNDEKSRSNERYEKLNIILEGENELINYISESKTLQKYAKEIIDRYKKDANDILRFEEINAKILRKYIEKYIYTIQYLDRNVYNINNSTNITNKTINELPIETTNNSKDLSVKETTTNPNDLSTKETTKDTTENVQENESNDENAKQSFNGKLFILIEFLLLVILSIFFILKLKKK